MAAGVAWYAMKSPGRFLQKEQSSINPAPSAKSEATAASKTTGTKPASVDENGKPRFEFYKVLTDKHDATVVAPAAPVTKTPANKAAVVYEPQILQAGSFTNVSDAENLKAKLALLGVEANIQTAAIPDKGVWYRVRLGPYKNADDIDRARSFLKQNGVDSTPMRAQ